MPSWYYNHSHDNPIEFFKNLMLELNFNNFHDFLDSLYNKFVPQKDTYYEIDISKTAYKYKDNPTDEYNIYSQLNFTDEELESLLKYNLISEKLKAELQRRLKSSSNKLNDRWNRDSTNGYNSAKDNRTGKENNLLKDWNTNEMNNYKNHIDKYSNLSILTRLNKDILFEEISVGYIFNTVNGCVIGNISSLLAYIDKNIVLFLKYPYYFLKNNFRNVIRNICNSYLSQVLVSHILTIPSLLTYNGKDLFSDKSLKYISNTLSTTITISINMSREKCKKLKDKFKNSMNVLFEISLSNISKFIIDKTLIGLFIRVFSAECILYISRIYGIILSPVLFSSILTGSMVMVFSRGLKSIFSFIKNQLNIKNIIDNETNQIDQLYEIEKKVEENKMLNSNVMEKNNILNGNEIRDNSILNGEKLKFI